MSGVAPAVVALGGGHGLNASLAALRRVTDRLTAVVTVADDGGSSGRLRTELGVLPPGDLRMALSALAGEDSDGRCWDAVSQHRFPGSGPLAGHPVGNLLLAGLLQVLGDPVLALDQLGRLLGTVGRVLPLSAVPLDLEADVTGLDPSHPEAGRTVRGQVAVATTRGRVVRLRCTPADPPACPETVTAIRRADWVVLGPGSWFTSVLIHLLVPEVRAALVDTPARRLVTLNLAAQPGETAGFAPETHLEVLVATAPDLRVDVVLADPAAVPDPDRLHRIADRLGAHVILAPVAEGALPRHDPARLAAAYSSVLRPGDASAATADRSNREEPPTWR